MSPSTDRQTFRETVALVAEKAKARLPQATNGRIESAARLVINGDVEPLDDGSIKVGGSDPTRWYHLVGPTCTCTDFVQGKAPSGWCKHRIAAGIQKRVQELLPPEPAPGAFTAGEPTPEPLCEARASLNFKAMVGAYEVQMTLRDATEGAILDRLRVLLKRQDIRPIPKPAPRSGNWKQRNQGH
jgi:hypothetical protein